MTMLTSAESNRGILPAEYSQLIVDPVTDAALAFDDRVARTVRTSGREFRIPLLVEDAAAAWTAEGEEIAPTEPVLDEITVVPSKIAGLSVISRELAEDTSPAAAELVGASLARAITLQVDRGFLGDLAAPAAKGLDSLTDVSVVEGALDSLDVVHEAKAAAAAEGGTASVILANPSDVLALALLKDESGSNRALVESTSTIAGLPVISSRHVAAGKLWVLDREQIMTVLREDVELATSTDSHFTSDRIAIRATMRIGFAFPRPASLVRVDLPTAGA